VYSLKNLYLLLFFDKSITENGEYNASADNADGYSKVTVDVAGGGGETFDFSVTLTFDTTGEDPFQFPATLTSDKTYSEIVTAYNNNDRLNPTVTMVTIDGENTHTTVLDFAFCSVGDGFIVIVGTGTGTGIILTNWVEGATTGTSSMAQHQHVNIVN
jgi:hypothetical protein